MAEYVRPFLKWPGGKYRLLSPILQRLPPGQCLLEPFVGAASVFLNSDYQRYILNDINPDLIAVYKNLQQQQQDFITDTKTFFQKKYNNEKAYYRLRKKFNESTDHYERSLIFLYLNRHGYNGLCRYNQQGQYNVPFGRYIKPYFPEAEMECFAEKASKARFYCEDFSKTMQRAKAGYSIYADPPYVPLNNTAYFTHYHSGKFGFAEQEKLALLAKQLAKKGVPVLVSNHHTDFTTKIYRGAKRSVHQVRRFISRDTQNRNAVAEVLALFR